MRAIARLAAVRPPPRARASSSETFDIAKRAAELGVRLTRKEMASLWRARNARTNAKITQSEYEALIRERLHHGVGLGNLQNAGRMVTDRITAIENQV